MLKVVGRIVCKMLVLAILMAGGGYARAQSLPVTSNVRIWLDAADVTAGGATPANGAIVTQWHDKSGNAQHATSTGSVSATYESSGMGGLPSIRLPIGSKFSHSNIFTANRNPQTTIFMVQANVTKTANFVLNLNGDNNATSGTNARFSMHLPWSNGNYYYDAGGCCGSTRLSGPYPVAITAPLIAAFGNSTTQYAGMTSTKQFVRFDGVTKSSDNSAISPYVTGGFRLGSTSNRSYNGRFSEIIIYDRALSLTEIQQVECYLSSKWNIAIPLTCTSPVTFSVDKSHVAFSANTYGDYAVPDNEFIYQIEVSHLSGNQFDSGSMFVVDTLPGELTFYNGDLDGASGPFTDPVGFTNAGSSLSFNPASGLKYSNSAAVPASAADCTYIPSLGYDPNVRHVCISLGGNLLNGAAELQYRTRLE